MDYSNTELPWNVHGSLQVSSNGHFIQHKDGTPFFWMGDTQWVLNNISDEHIGKLLDDRKEKGFSVIQVCAMRWWDLVTTKGDIAWSGTDAFGQLPFVDNDVLIFNRLYWERWRKLFDMAAARGLFVMFMAGHPGRKEGSYYCRSLDECYKYGKTLGEYFRGIQNLLYSASMDFEGTMGVGVEGWRAIAEGILAGDGGQDCFMTYHPYTSSSKWFHHDHWLKVNGIQGSRNETPDNDVLIYQRINADYNLTDPVKPVVLLEGSYEYERNNFDRLPPTTDRNIRMQFFYSFFAGAAGFTYGHCRSWQQFGSIAHLDSPGARQIAIGRKFLIGHDFSTFRPDQSVLVDGEGRGELRKAAVLSEDNSECMVFFPVQQEASIRLDKMRSCARVEASWFNPKDGTCIQDAIYSTSMVWPFLPPDGWEDAVLVLKSVD